jgi:hypothetical protein
VFLENLPDLITIGKGFIGFIRITEFKAAQGLIDKPPDE